MTKEEFFTIVNVSRFFPKYAPGVKRFNHKRRGWDGNGKPISFTKEDKAEIKNGLEQMKKDFVKIKL